MKTVTTLEGSGMAVGIFESSNEFIQSYPDKALQVMGEVIVLEARPIPNGVKYLALSKHFTESKVPKNYVAVFPEGADDTEGPIVWKELEKLDAFLELQKTKNDLSVGSIEWAINNLREGKVLTRKSNPNYHFYMVGENSYPANTEYAKKFSSDTNGMVKYSAYFACLNTACGVVTP